MFDVIALGELLIDFAQKEENTFVANPGGAPCNVLAILNKLNKKTAFIGKVGNDLFGYKLENEIKNIGINTEGLFVSKQYRTTLAFVIFDENGERDFSFYRNPGADMMLCKDEIPVHLIKQSKIFHFGTLSMTHEGVREATKYAIDYAKKNHLLISFDPNLRPPLWNNINDAKEQMKYGCSVCDILKIEDEELLFMTNSQSIDEGIQYLKDHYCIRLILITSGAKGSQAIINGYHIKKEAFLNKNTIDTTGAGDTFCGICLSYLCDNPINNLDEEMIIEMLTMANAGASIVTTRLGALNVMPTLNEIKNYLINFQNQHDL